MGSKTKTATSTSNTEPWAAQQPYIKDVMSQAKSQFNAPGPGYFPQSTVAGFSPEQNTAFGLGTQRATQGNAGMGIAQGYNNDVLSGKYLNSNPYQDDVYKNIESKVLPSVNSTFSGAGRYGSNSHQNAQIDQLTSAFAPYASQNYQYGLGQMDAAANRAPQFAANDWTDINALQGIGQQKQQLAQNELGDAVNRWNFYQDLPSNKLQQYAGLVGGSYGGNTTSTTPYQQPSIWSSIGGAALGLGGLFLTIALCTIVPIQQLMSVGLGT